MITIKATPTQVIRLGRLGENERMRIAFDVERYLDELPGASFVLLNQGPGDAAAYPCAAVELDGSTLYWTITSAELGVVGRGRCELIVTVDNVVAKSVIYDTQVLTALDGGGTVPPDWESWQETFAGLKADAETAAADAEAASQAIQDLRISARTNPVGIASVAKIVTPETGKVELRFGIPQGEPGVSPEIYVHDIQGGHRVMIIRADGTYVPVDVMDGEGMPTGGTAGQVLVKKSDTDYDMEWQTPGICDMIAPQESEQAINAYSVGGLFCFGGKLYKATTAIEAGDTIAPGTNCTQTTIAEMIGAN